MKKLSTGMIALIVVIALLVVFSVMAVGVYNGMISTRENVNTAQAAIDAQLMRRADLIPNLVETVKGLSAQEQSVIDSVTEARTQLAGAQSMEEKAAANDQLSSALSRLLMVVENYPEIQSSQGYISLMDELSGTENRITVARTDYNEAVKEYNLKITRFPGSLFAGIFGFEKAEYFTAPDSAQDAPQVDFS
ncbi:LemA family protein [Youxingia wuxianensis]|uniref:LemA family protein n=1 Tax=Youxingia wuxianensis TaxID=2763678 RepID=A0A926IGM2_9FIRM|nr:LemA family protein [Youxingia wuxianensis]MBC8584401.1 LemA family protein [Youxingia wuxianensis]